MRRKVCKVGPATLVVSLPSKWAKKYGVKKGDEVEISEDNNSLNISLTQSGNERKIAVIKQSSKEPLLIRQITRVYTAGYDEIKIYYDDNETLHIIEHTLNQLIGFEMFNIDDNFCVIRNISREIEDEFDNILRKLFYLTIRMGERCSEFLDRNNIKDIKKNMETQKITNKYTYFCQRILNKGLFNDVERTKLFTVVFMLEQVGDKFLDISTLLINGKEPVPKIIKSYFNKIIDIYRDYCNTFFKGNFKDNRRIRISHKNLESNLSKDLINEKNAHPLVIYFNSLLGFIEHLNQITC